MPPKCRASEEIRNLFYECLHEKKMLVRKHARSEGPVGERFFLYKLLFIY